MFHRPGLAHDLAAALTDTFAGGGCILYGDRDVPETVAEVVLGRVPVPGELDHRVLRLVAVSDERERESPVRVFVAAQQIHPEHLGIKGERTVEVADPYHRVQDPHVRTSRQFPAPAFTGLGGM